MGALLPVIVVVIAVGIFIWYIYNSLIVARIRVKEAWSQIDVQLQRRADLIPNLVETVKGYAKHEKSVFENVTKARSALVSAKTPQQKAKADGELTKTLKSLFAVAEGYPELKASENYLQLQKELSDTEDKVSYARQFYNTAVTELNTKMQVFPNVIFAQILGFKKEEFFESEKEAKKKVKVDMS